METLQRRDQRLEIALKPNAMGNGMRHPLPACIHKVMLAAVPSILLRTV
ncbi:hypothetical protein C7476_11530 [Phyllobacterium bourgognense]|uniref:Uncharacterized protein n=1 Tax=Phyllobacterium bourgognense TaxID=314236 RepID=A0A368YIR2_9HYPH|nr:hypothetical protein C7476_11530 [Phyllobacterium bourgognense]